jgi:hypothetical protein
MKQIRFGVLAMAGVAALVVTGAMAVPAGAAVKPSVAVQPHRGPKPPKPPKAPPGYTVVNSGAVDNPAGRQTRGTATCPTGTVVLGGGVYSSSGDTSINLNSSFPTGSTGWSADMNNASSEDASAVVYAVCAQRPKKYSIVESTEIENPSGEQTEATASCPANTQVLGGGGYSTSAELGVNLNSTLVNLQGWLVEMNNGSVADADAMAIAICGKEKAVAVAQSATAINSAGLQTVTGIACPGRTVPFGGGIFSSSPSLMININSTEPVDGGWESWENNASPDSDSINAWVVCGS